MSVPVSMGPGSTTPPVGWKWRKLTDLARLESGHTPSRRHPEWWGGEVPWIALPDIRALDGKVAFETSEHINADGLANSSARLLPADTVVLSRTASVGFVTIMGRPMATSQDFVNWICGPELDPHFLALLFTASRKFIRSLGSGAVHKTVYVPTVEAWHVCVPAIVEQKRIVQLIDEQSVSIERARVAAASRRGATEALTPARLRVLFDGSDANLWPARNLGEVAEIVSGVTLGRKLDAVATRSVPYLRVANVKDGYLDLADVGNVDATETEIKKLRLVGGDLLLTEGGDRDKLGRGTFWQEEIPECIHQNHIFRVRLNRSALSPEFVAAQVGSSYGKRYFLAHAKQTTGIATINQGVLARFPLLAPPLDEQHRVVATLNAERSQTRKLLGAVMDELPAIEALRAALLRKAFAGQL